MIRLTIIWQQQDVYPDFLQRIRDHLGTKGWRLTLDILRFTPVTASIIAQRYPEPAVTCARAIAPDGEQTLRALARDALGREAQVKKYAPGGPPGCN